MFSALKKILGIRTANDCLKPALFSGSAYFSIRVPKSFSDKWVANGGDIASGTTLDVRARYFFATDPSEPWTTKLFAKSVMVIHAGWIAHCVEEAFLVPISEYILDDQFVPGPPYKLINHLYVPLSDPVDPAGEPEPALVQSSDAPSTPTSMPRKRKREQAYFDSPSGSFVFSAFDKDGVPRRPRKLRRLRFDPSFSPSSGRSGEDTAQPMTLDLPRDHDDGNDDEFSEEHVQGGGADATRGVRALVRPPHTPDRLYTNGAPSPSIYQPSSAGQPPSNLTRVSSPAILVAKRETVRTIDFTNLPPPIRRRRFAEPDVTKSRDADMKLSIVRSTPDKPKTPKKISFASHARVTVYDVSPGQRDMQEVVSVGSVPRPPSPWPEEETSEANGDARMQSDEAWGPDSAAEVTKDTVESDPKISDDLTRLRAENEPKNDALTLTTAQVQTVRRHLLELATTSGVDGGQPATLFELGATYRGMTFRHVW